MYQVLEQSFSKGIILDVIPDDLRAEMEPEIISDYFSLAKYYPGMVTAEDVFIDLSTDYIIRIASYNDEVDYYDEIEQLVKSGVCHDIEEAYSDTMDWLHEYYFNRILADTSRILQANNVCHGVFADCDKNLVLHYNKEVW